MSVLLTDNEPHEGNNQIYSGACPASGENPGKWDAFSKYLWSECLQLLFSAQEILLGESVKFC